MIRPYSPAKSPHTVRHARHSLLHGMLLCTALCAIPTPASARAQNGSAPGAENQVLVMGMIHGEHRTSQRYGIATLKTLLARIAPDVVLTEIPPDRFEAASREFASTGQITEPRVKSFPEYTEVLFPLQKQLGYQIVPTAGWTLPMHTARVAALKRLASDPARAKEWAEYQAADKLSDQMVAKGGAPDDPAWIHSDGYDQALEIGLSAYNRFNNDLGPGGWDNINTSHYGHIARWLDQHAYQGKRVLITYGAGHKGWFLRQLRQRKDIQLLEMKPFL